MSNSKRPKLTRHSDDEEEEEPVQIIYEEERPNAVNSESLAALQDEAERDAFAQRLLARDKERTRNVAASAKDNLTSTMEAEDARRLKLVQEAADRQSALEQLREISRQEYLTKREEQKVLLLEKELEDESHLFGNDELTVEEMHELQYKQRLLELVKQKKQLEDKEKLPQYSMPENYIDERDRLARQRKERELYERYRVPEDSQESFHKEDEWEKTQLYNAKNLLGIGKKEREALGEEYGFLLDESQIEFVLQTTLEGDDSLIKRQDPIEQARMERQRKADNIQEVRKSLPVYGFRSQLLEAIEAFQVLIIVGETGSGKTTQIPQYLYESGYTSDGKKKIGCTQPRRVAAMSVSARVAQELNSPLGHTVGYSIRFEDCTSERTVLKYMTDGMLIREFLQDPELSEYSVIMIDEAHERTVSTDVLFGLLKDLLRVRTDLKLLISSATLDADKFSRFFDDAPIFNIPGRRYPVDIYYAKAPEADYLNAVILTVMQIHLSQPLPGDILVFLTGQEDIEVATESLNHVTKALGPKIPELIIAPIYASLPSEMQAKIFTATPKGARKVVLATNIAETSITIDGIIYVIDPGLVKQKSYHPKTGLESLVVVPCAKAAANQRAGRAGRLAPGKCFRLYTRWSFDNELDDAPIPEIQRSDLCSVVLLLKSLGIHDLLHFEFMDAPPPDTLIRSLEQLYALGALNKSGSLTKLGRRMAELPLPPQLGRTLLASEQYACSEEIITIAAMLSLQASLFYRPPVKEQRLIADNLHKSFLLSCLPGGDPLLLLYVYQAWSEANYSQQWCYENYLQYKSLNRARTIRDQLEALLTRVEVPLVSISQSSMKSITSLDPSIPIRKAITAGYFYNVARLSRSGDSYKNMKTNQPMHIHPSSCLFRVPGSGVLPPRFILYYELILTSKEYMRQNIEILPEWLTEVAPHYHITKDKKKD